MQATEDSPGTKVPLQAPISPFLCLAVWTLRVIFKRTLLFCCLWKEPIKTHWQETFTDRNWHSPTWNIYEKERIIKVQAHRGVCLMKMAAPQIWVCPGPHTKGQGYIPGRRRRAKGKIPLRRTVISSAQPSKLCISLEISSEPISPKYLAWQEPECRKKLIRVLLLLSHWSRK